jgi:hypothetical protein
LCVCDDNYTAELRCRVLASVGYEPVSASVAEAFDLLASQRFDAMVLAPQINDRIKAALRNAAGAHVKTLHLRRGQAGNLLVQEVHSLFKPDAPVPALRLKRSHSAS